MTAIKEWFWLSESEDNGTTMIAGRFLTIASRLHSANGRNRLTASLDVRRKMHLLLNKNFINGQWVAAANNEQVPVLNPVDNAVIGQVPDLSASDVQNAIDAAYAAFHGDEWGSLTAKERSALLKVSSRTRK